MNKKKLRIGLLIDNNNVPYWIYSMVEEINSSHHSEIVLVVKKKNTKGSDLSILKKARVLRKQLFYTLYCKLDRRFFISTPNAFALKDLKGIIKCAELEVEPNKENLYDMLPAKDIAKIQGHSIDVFIQIGFGTLKGEILQCAKYGVWSYQKGGLQSRRGGPPGVWEVFENETVTSISLQILAEHPDDNRILRTSHSPTDPISVARTMNSICWKASSFVPRKLNQLYGLGKERFLQIIDEYTIDPVFYSNKLYSVPSNLKTIKGAGSNFWAAIKRRIHGVFYFKQWILLYKLEGRHNISKSFFQFQRITPPKDRIWADPFVLYKDNKHFIFIEEMLFSENKGKIAVIEIDNEGNYYDPKVIIENNYHMSYPLLLEEQGELYMLPETGANRTIELYRCIEFPLKWELAKVLIDDIYAKDATLFKHDDKYWMFANVKEVEGVSVHDELFLFYTDNLLKGKWRPHPMNPIVSDVRCARPAGNVFVHNGCIYRPSQNCSKEYGYGMQIREIVTLTEESYSERQVQSIYPNWAKDLIGTHTLNSHGGLTVIDALIKRRK